MAREKKIYECSDCGLTSPRWLGRCPQCESWNSFAERIDSSGIKSHKYNPATQVIPIVDGDADEHLRKRVPTGIEEYDRVIGGGVIPGEVILISGEPGIGKSTLVLQIAGMWSKNVGSVLYVHGEESFHQVKDRASRINAIHDNLFLSSSTSLQEILSIIDEHNFSLIIIDSIQSINNPEIDSLPGSITQVRECTFELVQKAKEKNTPMLIIGHITKEGYVAGPKVLEHIVDTVLYFEGEGKFSIRILRAMKNRFGSTQEIGVFEMSANGLKEVSNPSAIFLQERPRGVSGSIVMPIIGGSRPLLVEVQALVGKTRSPQPRRGIMGLNSQRVSLLIAILEKKAGIFLADRDIFVNVTGGIFVDETSADLPVLITLLSSFWEFPLRPDWVAFGEVGLTGEVRRVNATRTRLNEISKFGFKTCIIPNYELTDVPENCKDVQLIPLKNVNELNNLFTERKDLYEQHPRY